MNNSPSQSPESKAGAPVAVKSVGATKPGPSKSPVIKAKVVAKAPRTPSPTPAKLTPVKPVDKVLVPASRKAPAKAKVKAATIALSTAKPADAATPVDKVRTSAKREAKAEKAAAEVLVSAASQAKLLKDEKKSKEPKHAGKKPKLVRDSFTFPAADYAVIGVLKQRALTAGHEIKKSELLRAGLLALSALSDAALIRALGAINKLKPGRPSK